MAYQNAWSAVKITRNQGIIKGNRTNSMFLYETPFVRFANKLTPLLDNPVEINIAKINSETARKLPLEQHLKNLFSTFYKKYRASISILKLECEYYYTLDNNTALSKAPVKIPIVLATPAEFHVPGDWNVPSGGCPPPTSEAHLSFVCKLTKAIKEWFKQNMPGSNDGTFQFDISVFSSLNETTLPLIRLRNVILEQQDITDLNLHNKDI